MASKSETLLKAQNCTPPAAEPPSPSAQPAAQKKPFVYTDSDTDLGFSNPLLNKVKQLLLSTEPDHWHIGGDELTSESRFGRPRNFHAQVLVRDIPNGSLLLHCKQPVQSQYVPGGYALNPLGAAHYTIEVRDRIFDPNKVVDPKYADNWKGKRLEVIATGDIAKSLFLQVRETIKGYQKQRKKEFDEATARFIEEIHDLMEQTPFEAWKKEIEETKEERDLIYTTDKEGITILVGMKTKDWESEYRVVFTKGNFIHDKLPRSTAKLCFKKLEELEQNAQLQKLASTLKDLGVDEG